MLKKRISPAPLKLIPCPFLPYWRIYRLFMLKLMDTYVVGNWQKSADTDVKIVWQLQISSFILQKLFPGFLRTFHFCLAQMILQKPIGIVFNFFSAKKPLLLQALRGIYLIAFLILKACLRYIMTSTISEENYLKSLSNKIRFGF